MKFQNNLFILEKYLYTVSIIIYMRMIMCPEAIMWNISILLCTFYIKFYVARCPICIDGNSCTNTETSIETVKAFQGTVS